MIVARDRFLVRQWRVPRFTFFIGKGGVGKTTISSAYALHRAAQHPRQCFLLLSTDPAHSLADVLQVKVGSRPRRLPVRGKVWAQQLNAEKQIKSFLGFERKDIAALLDRGSFFTRGEIEQLLDTTLPGMAEVAALLAIHDLVESSFEEIVVDTAPMGHAIRLFQMPEHFARFLGVLETAAARDMILAQHFGGVVHGEPALERWSRMVDRLHRVLSAEWSRLMLVTTPEPFSLNQSLRTAGIFEATGLENRISGVILNRSLASSSSCPRCKRRSARSRNAQQFLRKHFERSQLFIAGDPGGPILGIDALCKLGRHVFEGRKLPLSVVAKPASSTPVKARPAAWPLLATPLGLTAGKGGVGKTTISAALAYHHHQRAKNEGLTVVSIDPAPSLSDVFSTAVGQRPGPVLGSRRLRAAELDATAQFRQWADRVRDWVKEAFRTEEGGVHLDLSLDRNFFISLLDVVPPGVDEIFAILRMLELPGRNQRLLIDMAPTGQALEVLRTPERLLAWSRVLLKTLAVHRTLPLARDVAVEIAKLSQKIRDLATSLRDPARCSVTVVVLPEPLPDYETRRLVKLLHELKLPTATMFINRVLLDGDARCPRCRLAREWQGTSIAALRRQFPGATIYLVREFDSPVAGGRALQRFTRELWQLA